LLVERQRSRLLNKLKIVLYYQYPFAIMVVTKSA